MTRSNLGILSTPHRRHRRKTLLTIDGRGSKIARNSAYESHLSPVGRQMAIENYVSNNFDLRSSIVLTFSIAAYPMCYLAACFQCKTFMKRRQTLTLSYYELSYY